jgi:hypothetical protein
MLQAGAWYFKTVINDLLEQGLQTIANTITNEIRHGSSQMSVISVINATRFPFHVTDSAAYKGSILTTFTRLEACDSVQEGQFTYIGIFTSNSGVKSGSASAVAITSEASTVEKQDTLIIAAAAPIIGKRTTLISINDPAMTAYKLADENDTAGQGKSHDEGDGNHFHIWADVETNAFNQYCHVRVYITEIGI